MIKYTRKYDDELSSALADSRLGYNLTQMLIRDMEEFDTNPDSKQDTASLALYGAEILQRYEQYHTLLDLIARAFDSNVAALDLVTTEAKLVKDGEE
jgi:Rod binding domain-containing protein